MKEIKRYQEEAINELLLKTDILLKKSLDKRTIVFQSPTGSGKTFMVTKYIQSLINKYENEDFCFLWISIGKGNLHYQSYHAIKSEFNGFPNCYLLEEEFFGSRATIERNEVVIVNWEKLRAKDGKTGEWKNILMKDKETTNFRELISNTRDENRKIIMIIDESHSNATSERAKELRDEIVSPHLTIEMSATPIFTEGEYNEKIVVQPNDVINEGIIKKEIIINENIDEISEDEIDSQELIMQAAFNKRLELKRQFDEEEIKVNPLVLIQLPTSEAGEEKKAFVETFLAEKGITTDNNKLAVWLSEEKINTEVLENNLSEVDFLIFKQAIDTGWNCPRAQVLVRFREIRSIVFEIQTIGRILRMPEAKHYLNDNLNKGFVYTNLQNVVVQKEVYNPNIIKSVLCKRKEIYKPVKLRSYYRNRIDYGDVTASAYNVLENVFCDYFGIKRDEISIGFYDKNKDKIRSKGIEIDSFDNSDEIILNKVIDTKLFDHIDDRIISSDKLFQSRLSQEDLSIAFDNLIKINLNGFAPKRSISTVKQAIYRWFKKYLNVKIYGSGVVYIQNVCLNNFEEVSKLIDKTINTYKPIKESEKKEKIKENEIWDENWEIPSNRNYNPNTYQPYNFKLSLYQPCYLNLDSEIEKEFIEKIDNKDSEIEWWWQNGNEHMALNFGIKYGEDSTFQPDFIVMYKDGRIGIFDTKTVGDREDENKIKNEALQKYIEEENKKGKNLFGGLVIKPYNHFMLNSSNEYQSFRVNEKSWEYFA